MVQAREVSPTCMHKKNHQFDVWRHDRAGQRQNQNKRSAKDTLADDTHMYIHMVTLIFLPQKKLTTPITFDVWNFQLISMCSLAVYVTSVFATPSGNTCQFVESSTFGFRLTTSTRLSFNDFRATCFQLGVLE